MNKALFLALCFVGLSAGSPGVSAANTVDSTGPSPDSTGPTNPVPPTLPTPGTGIETGTGTGPGLGGPDNVPAPGKGTKREDSTDSPSYPKTADPAGPKRSQDNELPPDN